MNYKTLLYEKRGRIARITLNRPRRLNAISRDMPREIRLLSPIALIPISFCGALISEINASAFFAFTSALAEVGRRERNP